jgi:tetratricopeptide (TPR) repeat protein
MADQTDQRLDALFAELKQADSPTAAHFIEQQIWAIWIRSDDGVANALMRQGTELLGAGDFDGALALFDQLVAHAPNFAEAWNKRATTLYLLGRFGDSVRDIGRVLALEPRHFGALSGLGMCDVRLSRIKDALDAMMMARAVDPKMAGIDDNIAELQRRLDDERI